MKGFERGKREIRVWIEEQDRFIEIRRRYQWQRESCLDNEGMTIFDKTTAPSCGFLGLTQSRHYTIVLEKEMATHSYCHHQTHLSGADEIKPRARCDLWNPGPHLYRQDEEFRERFIPPLRSLAWCSTWMGSQRVRYDLATEQQSFLGANGAHWGCCGDANALKCKRTIEIGQSFCFDSFKSPKGYHQSAITCPLPAQLLGFSQIFGRGESQTRAASGQR